MKKDIGREARLTIFLGLTFLFMGCVAKPAQIEIGHAQNPEGVQTKITKQQAIEIARKEALKTHDSLEEFSLVPCETTRAWLVIYDGGGPEYVISKEAGTILVAKKIPQGPAKDENFLLALTEPEAIDIAKREAATLFGEDIVRYDVFTCQLSTAWVVGFEYREVPGELLPNSRSPLYVIDKRARKVIYKEG